jgi:hypothetical protein
VFTDNDRGPSLREKGLFCSVVLVTVLLLPSISPESVFEKTRDVKICGAVDRVKISVGLNLETRVPDLLIVRKTSHGWVCFAGQPSMRTDKGVQVRRAMRWEDI